jgi:hypothetical protein
VVSQGFFGRDLATRPFGQTGAVWVMRVPWENLQTLIEGLQYYETHGRR